jgi:hypothetical protein
MLQTISLDSKTMIIKADSEVDLLGVIDYIDKQERHENIKDLLQFASKNKILPSDYQFNREDCYDR